MSRPAVDLGAVRAGRVGAAWWGYVLAGLAYAVLIIAAFPPVGWWWASGAAIVPLVWAAFQAGGRAKRGGWWWWVVPGVWTAVGSAPFWAWHMRFLIDVTAAGYPGLIVYFSVYAGVFVVVGGMMVAWLPGWLPRGLALGGLYSLTELVRGEVVLQGLPWFLLAQPWIEVGPVARMAGTVGVYGVSLVLAIGQAGVAGLIVDRKAWGGAVVSGLVVAAGLWIGLTSAGVSGGGWTLRFGVVQTNLPQSNKMGWGVERKLADFEEFLRLTREVSVAGDERGPDVIAWPETMFPGLALNAQAVQAEREAKLAWRVKSAKGEERAVPTTYFHDKLVTVQAELGVPMFVGGLAVDGLRILPREGGAGGVRMEHDGRFNSVFMVDGGIVREGRYDKMVLTPFGEVIPYVWRVPALQAWVVGLGAAGMEFDLGFGQTPTVFEVAARTSREVGGAGATVDRRRARVATPICFEATVPWLCRALVYDDRGERRADVIMSPSNDGWFGRWPGGREYHQLFARWRCVELGVPMVRSVNTGISSAIGADGRILATIDGVDVAGVLLADVEIPAAQSGTFYGRHGDVLAWSWAGLTGLLAVWAWAYGWFVWWFGRRGVS